MEIGETLCRALAKLVMRASWDQAKIACGNLQLCSGLEASTEGATYDVGQRRLERMWERRGEEEEAENSAEEEEERGGVTGLLNNLTIETAGTEEEVAQGLATALEMEVYEDRGSEGEDEGWWVSKGTGRP